MTNWNYAHVFHDGAGEPASGAQVMENLEQAKAEIEALEEGRMKTPAAQVAENTGTSGTPSATRPAFVTVRITNGGGAMAVNVFAGASKVTRLVSAAGNCSVVVTFLVAAGEEWKASEGEGAFTTNFSYRLV